MGAPFDPCLCHLRRVIFWLEFADLGDPGVSRPWTLGPRPSTADRCAFPCPRKTSDFPQKPQRVTASVSFQVDLHLRQLYEGMLTTMDRDDGESDISFKGSLDPTASIDTVQLIWLHVRRGELSAAQSRCRCCLRNPKYPTRVSGMAPGRP